MTNKIAVVGATGAGKTVYLSCLFRAAFADFDRRQRPAKLRPIGDDNQSQQYFSMAESIFSRKSPEGTKRIEKVSVALDLPGAWLANLGKETSSITFIDPPGGDCMPACGRDMSEDMKSALRESDNLLLLLPAEDRTSPSEQADRLDAFFESVRSLKNSGSRPAFSRVAVAITKAELLVADSAVPMATLDNMNPRTLVAERFGTEALQAITHNVAKGGDWYSAISAFGFRRDSGAMASRLTRDGWVYDAGDVEVAGENWQPYRLFEPLEFLVRGVCWQETYG